MTIHRKLPYKTFPYSSQRNREEPEQRSNEEWIEDKRLRNGKREKGALVDEWIRKRERLYCQCPE
jgi:hypothetical protein